MMVHLGDKIENQIWAFVNRVCGLPLSNRDFPGGLPVSISRSLLKRISGIHEWTHLEYAGSHKADGHRMYAGFLCIEGDFISFVVDRRGVIKRIDLQFYPIAYEGTLLDVEMEGDDIIILDCGSVNGNICVNEFYPNRLEIARNMLHVSKTEFHYPVIHVVHAEPEMYTTKYNHATIQAQKWKVQVKILYYQSKMTYISNNALYKDDGLIWSLTTAPFHTFKGKKLAVLKWKPVNRITIDFIISHRETPMHFNKNLDDVSDEVNIEYRKYRTNRYSHRMIAEHYTKTIWFSTIDTDVENGIYECCWNKIGNKWEIMNARTDKNRPNSLTTVINTIQNIDEALELQDLSAF
jgi:hypothetical protein